MVDEADILRGSAVRATELTGEAEAEYVQRLYRILRAARLNTHYPDARKMQAHVRCMSPRVHRGLYDGVQVNLDSGLPTYREWTRVQTDVGIAGEQLAKLGPRSKLEQTARDSGRDIHQKLLAKHQYYSDIEGTELAPLGNMDVALRRVVHETNTAYFNVVLDKLDASGLFVRYAIQLSQTASVWNQQVVRLDEETAEHTEGFQSLIYKFTSLDSAFTFAKLAGLGGLEVERVAKGTVGPIYLAAEQAPEALGELFEGGGDRFVAMFSLDMVAGDIAESRDNDPLEDSMIAGMDAKARQTFERAHQKFDVRTFRDRKFVVPRQMIGKMRAFCEARGTKNIVYGI
jgi:hypothetical protein